MALQKITTPKGFISIGEGGKAELTWNANFAAKRNQSFGRAQKFVDSEVLRYCSPLVPFQTGMLEKSGILGTDVGSGEVEYVAPYAKRQYHTREARSYDANRGGKWFERMKASHKKDILDGAKKIQ